MAEARFWFPAGDYSETLRRREGPNPLDQWPGTHQLPSVRISTERQKVVKQASCLLRRKTIHVDRHTGRLRVREVHACMVV